MSDRPTREECIKWVKMEAIFSEADFEKEAFAKEMVRQLAEATIHYLTEGATPDMFAEETA